ncbi:PD-(D/E)XK nuclease family protein [Dehalococcoidia bacterium]|nr:PD-(D/E)XK nuclease family protein [Dehalococcoidia bacterium]
MSREYNVDRGDEKWIRISFDMTDITEQLNTFVTDSRVKALQGKIKSFDISDGNFDMFKVMGVSSSELTHSNVLGWLLDPEKSHGIGNNFATAFFGEAVGLELNPDFDFHSMEIRREWQNIDLCCVSPANRFVCVIENKTDSGEHDNQLNRYYQIIAKEFPDYEKSFVYLTVDGENPSSDEYIPVSYRKIDRIVQQLMCDLDLDYEVSVFLDHYRRAINSLTGPDDDVRKLASSIYEDYQGLTTGLKDGQITSDTESEVIKFISIPKYRWSKTDTIRELVEKYIDDNNELFSLGGRNGLYITRFTMKELDDLVPRKGDGTWGKSDRIVLFEFSSNARNLELVIGKGDESIRNKLGNVAITEGPYPRLLSERILDEKDVQNRSDEELFELISNRTQAVLDDLVPPILDRIKHFRLK